MMLHSRKNIAVLSGFTVSLLIFYFFRWGLLGLVSIGPPKRACENIRTFNAYLKTGGNPSAYHSRTPLITCAVESSSQEIVAHLLDLQVDIESPKKSSLIYFLRPPFDTGTTPLYAAARDGDLPLVKLLVNRGADPQREGRGWSDSPFNVAMENGHAAVVQYFLDTKGYELVLNQYVIEKAARKGHIDVLNALVDSGLWTNNKGGYNQALTFAAQGGDFDTIKMLLSLGADINGGGVATPPLHFVAVSEDFEIAKYLIDNGADVNATTPRKDKTPASWAAELGRYATLQFLITHGADVNISDYLGNTPLHYAVSPVFERQITQSDRHKVIEMLLKNDIDIYKKNNDGKTAIDLAKQKDRPEIVDWLTSPEATTGR